MTLIAAAALLQSALLLLNTARATAVLPDTLRQHAIEVATVAIAQASTAIQSAHAPMMMGSAPTTLVAPQFTGAVQTDVVRDSMWKNGDAIAQIDTQIQALQNQSTAMRSRRDSLCPAGAITTSECADLDLQALKLTQQQQLLAITRTGLMGVGNDATEQIIHDMPTSAPSLVTPSPAQRFCNLAPLGAYALQMNCF